MAYAPVTFTKGGQTRISDSPEEEMQLAWDGWHRGAPAPPPSVANLPEWRISWNAADRAASTASIVSAANAAKAAGGGVVRLPAATMATTGPLPVLPGVHYIGTEPILIPSNTADGAYLGDMDWTYGGGTVIKGDGTFAAFEANATDQASVQSDIGTTQISSAGIHDVGIDNVTYGIHVGATNIMGLLWSTVRNVYVRAASQWGVSLVNFQHCRFENIRTCLSQNGQYYGNRLPKLTLMCGNSVIGELYNFVPRDGRDSRLCRGIVFASGGTNAQLNELLVTRIQANQMSRSKLSVSAGMTSGVPDITVPNGAQFAVGMPVVPTTAAGGLTASQCYVVASVSGNTITLANDRVSAAVSSSATGTVTLESFGFPCVEVTRENTGANVRASRFQMLDLEGESSAALYVDGGELSEFSIAETPITGHLHHGVVGRSARWCRFTSPTAAPTDFDSNSTSSEWYGQRGPIIGRELSGKWLDGATGAFVAAFGGGQAGQTLGDLQVRSGGFLYPAAGMGERIYTRDSAITLGGPNAGDVIFAGSAAQTFTLPTIATDATSPVASAVGIVFDVINVGTGTVTVVTNGTQLFNKVAAKTSLSVAPQNGLKVIGAKDNSGNLFWVARAYTLA